MPPMPDPQAPAESHDAGAVIVEAFLRFLPILLVMVAFGFVYWIVRRTIAAREEKKRKAWIEERRAMRTEKPAEPADR
jgi:hypothetical protein